ncbi:putative Reticuline oxidase precursor [Hibiscus syriacus]|uniref:Reticuline oxidase n=1 Tax=Hibiscus syriacus TaxID=106335 RepID=A0A6A2WIX7_HIBSY|nr:berberine bridge enzyme-like 14 [Hibiscus syriacus]KAE8658888.1 putative Reticuline oxidase precursor [Hibiscus syriacus]
MNYPNSSILPFIALSLLLLSSWLPCRATSHSSSLVDNFLRCLSNRSAPLLESVYTRTNPSFESVLQARIRNRRFLTYQTPKPVAIVAPKHVSHVQATVVCAKDNGLQIRIRSGGHDFEGLSYTSNITFLVLDMFNLQSIKVDVNNEVAYVQAGVTLGELYYKIAYESGVHAFPAGICTTLGVGGHFTGGGYGNMMRKYGLSVDNVLDVEVVDITGNILNRTTMGEDLFWAIRGGGGESFAVIVAWKIKLVRVPEKVTVFNVPFTLEQGATDVAFKWQQVAPKLDENLFIRLQSSVVNGSILINFIGFFLEESDKLIPLMNQTFPELNLTKTDCIETSWIESVLYWAGFPTGTSVVALLNTTHGTQYYTKIKSDYVKTVISKQDLDTVWKLLIDLANSTSASVSMNWNPYGGKMSQIPESDTPFPHRSGNLFLIQYVVYWTEEGSNVTNHNIDRVRYMHYQMSPFVSKMPREAFLNYRDNDIGSTASDRTNIGDALIYGPKYFKDNFQRLMMVKAKVDPDNFFKNEQSIPPMIK